MSDEFNYLDLGSGYLGKICIDLGSQVGGISFQVWDRSPSFRKFLGYIFGLFPLCLL